MGHTTIEGDVFGLPLADGSEALCRVLFKSQYFRNVILIGIYGRLSERDPIAQVQSAEPFTKMYASCESLDNGEWRYLANLPVSEHERHLSKRIVGGDVWLGDEKLGPTSEGTQTLPQMDVHGDHILQRKVERYIAV